MAVGAFDPDNDPLDRYLDQLDALAFDARVAHQQAGIPTAVHVREFVGTVLAFTSDAETAELELALRWLLTNPESKLFTRRRRLNDDTAHGTFA